MIWVMDARVDDCSSADDPGVAAPVGVGGSEGFDVEVSGFPVGLGKLSGAVQPASKILAANAPVTAWIILLIDNSPSWSVPYPA